MRGISLTPALRGYLRSTDYLSPDLREIVEARLALPAPQSNVPLSLDDETAERFRTAFTVPLGKAGFGPNYELLAEGALLEDLMDNFAAE